VAAGRPRVVIGPATARHLEQDLGGVDVLEHRHHDRSVPGGDAVVIAPVASDTPMARGRADAAKAKKRVVEKPPPTEV